MKKIFTLIALAAMALGVNAQTATDTYLDVANYESLDNIDLKNCTKLYSYDAEKKVLVLSAYAAYQSSKQSQEADGKTGLGFVTYTSSGSSSVDGGWQAQDDFMGSQYYGLLSGGNASDRAAAIKSANAYTFKVKNITKVSILGKSGKKTERQVILTVKEGETEVANKIDDTNTIVAMTVDNLDASKTYDITVTGNSSSNGHFYEIAFYQAGGSGDQPETPKDPTAATTWNFASELSSNDAANLEADAANWEYTSDGYWANKTVLAERNVFATLSANGVALDVVKGIQFTRDNNSGLDAGRIRIAPAKYFAVNGTAILIKFAELVKDDVVKMRIKGAGTSARQITITNGDVASIESKTEGEGEEAKTVEFETEFKVSANGDVILAPSNGFQFMAITINADLPEVVVDGIETVKTHVENNGAIYNLAGQKVSESYKGVVIQNGVKMVRK